MIRQMYGFLSLLMLLAAAIPVVAQGSAEKGAEDWTMSRGGRSNHGQSSSADVTNPKIAWSYSATSQVSTEIVARDGVIYFHDQSTIVHAVNLADGKALWTSKPRIVQVEEDRPAVIDEGDLVDLNANQAVSIGCTYSNPLLAGDHLYSCTQAGVMTAYRAKDGTKVWEKKFANQIFSSPRAWKNLIIISCLDRKVYALDAATGEERWSVETGDIIGSTPFVTKGGTIYLASYDKHLYTIKAKNGKVKKKLVYGSRTNAHLCYANASLFFPMTGKKFGCWDVIQGEFRWTATRAFSATMQTPVYVASKDEKSAKVIIPLKKKLVCFRASDGTELWSNALDSASAVPATLGKTLIYHPTGKTVSAYNIETGKLAYRFKLKGSRAPVGLIDGNLLCFDANGQVHCFRSSK